MNLVYYIFHDPFGFSMAITAVVGILLGIKLVFFLVPHPIIRYWGMIILSLGMGGLFIFFAHLSTTNLFYLQIFFLMSAYALYMAGYFCIMAVRSLILPKNSLSILIRFFFIANWLFLTVTYIILPGVIGVTTPPFELQWHPLWVIIFLYGVSIPYLYSASLLISARINLSVKERKILQKIGWGIFGIFIILSNRILANIIPDEWYLLYTLFISTFAIGTIYLLGTGTWNLVQEYSSNKLSIAELGKITTLKPHLSLIEIIKGNRWSFQELFNLLNGNSLFIALSLYEDYPEMKNPSQIARELKLNPSTVTYTLKKLIQENFIYKKIEMLDQRKILYGLTEEGYQRMSSVLNK